MLSELERSMIYYPSVYPEGNWNAEDFGLTVEDCWFTTPDSIRLHGWFASSDSATRTLLWFHGNAGNITHRLDNLRLLIDRGINVFIFDYRGYGRSEGEPDEQGLYADGRAAFDFLVDRKNINPEDIIFFAQSLGTAIAVDVALDRTPAGIILEAAFTDAKAMARVLLPLVPVGSMLKTKFDNIGKIKKLRIPVLVIHGDRDSIVPYELGEKLYEAANQPKKFYTIPGADHNDTYIVGGDQYFSTLQKWWNAL
jgi:uncharacterized protein